MLKRVDKMELNSTVKVSDLCYKHVHTLGKLLDGNRMSNWSVLGKKIFESEPENIDRVDFMCHSYEEHNAPSMKLMRDLAQRKPDITIAEFSRIAEKLQRNDILIFLDSLLYSSMLLLDLTTDQSCKLIRLLEKISYGINNWRSFADSLEYSYDEILRFEDATTSILSPTSRLIRLITHTKPTMTLTMLMRTLHEIGRKDVANYVKTIIMEL